MSTCVGGYQKKCLLDETLPEYPRNVYYCEEDSAKTECCIVEEQGSCCEPKDEAMK